MFDLAIGHLATGHFEAKFFSKGSTSGHKSSIDTGLMILWCPGAEPISGHTNKQSNKKTFLDIIYNIIDNRCNRYNRYNR